MLGMNIKKAKNVVLIIRVNPLLMKVAWSAVEKKYHKNAVTGYWEDNQ